MLTTRTQCQCVSRQVAIDALIHVLQQGHGNSLRLSTLNVAQQSQHSTLSLPTTEGFSAHWQCKPSYMLRWHTTSCKPANDSITIWMVPPSGVRVRRLWHSAHSSGTQAHNREPAAGSEDSVPEWDVLNRMMVDPDTAHTELASNPDFIDLTLSD